MAPCDFALQKAPCLNGHHIPLQALPIFLDRLADPITAVLISITVVLIFGGLSVGTPNLQRAEHAFYHCRIPSVNCATIAGEIIPQAVCSRYGLQVGAYSAWFVRVLMVLCAVIAWPISKILDALLGKDHQVNLSKSRRW